MKTLRIVEKMLVAGVTLFVALSANVAWSQQRIRDVCRVKGQEENTLRGVGLIVGLNGTGDPNLPSTPRALARMLSNTGAPLPKDQLGQDLINELKDVRNAALVFVTATVPAAGARQGDQLDCRVDAWGNAKSLKGGYLLTAMLTGGPATANPDEQVVLATAQGPVHLEDETDLVSGKIHGGCRLEVTFANHFSDQGVVTLVLDKDHANFKTAQDIAERINSHPDFNYGTGGVSEEIAKAMDQVNILVRIPDKYQPNPVLFVSDLLDLALTNLQSDARVVVNERTGTVVIGENVVIAPVVVTHKNFTIEAGPFHALDPNPDDSVGNPKTIKLKALVDALNALKASPQDVIDVVKTLKNQGALYGQLIIE